MTTNNASSSLIWRVSNVYEEYKMLLGYFNNSGYSELAKRSGHILEIDVEVKIEAPKGMFLKVENNCGF